MFRKSSAVSLLLWLLVAAFFNQIEGNNPVSSNSSKNTNTCLQGTPGLPGVPGRNGHNGLPGRDGRDGSRGQKGDAGENGADADHRNWKQCAWKGSDARDIALIKDCVFYKRKDDTTLRVVYQGNFYLACHRCCKRWFITFNGAECSGPLPIEVVWWMASVSHHSHRPGSIEGYCDNIHKGNIRVGINIGNCANYGNADGITGWHSVSRLIIEEVPRSQ